METTGRHQWSRRGRSMLRQTSRGHFTPRDKWRVSYRTAKWEKTTLGTALNIEEALEKAGVRADAVHGPSFDGLGSSSARGSPDLVKALDIDHALRRRGHARGAMNGEDWPMLNGYLGALACTTTTALMDQNCPTSRCVDKAFEGFG